MRGRRPGLGHKWSEVVDSLQGIVPSYEMASSRISLFSDSKMREESVGFAVTRGALVLDLGAGPGTMSRIVARDGGAPVLVDVSRVMLAASSFGNRVQATFEELPFRDGVFDAIVSGFALRDSKDLVTAVSEVSRVLAFDGRFSFCDLGKSDSSLKRVLLACYLFVAPSLIGLASAGRAGLRYGSIYSTYLLTLRNSELCSLLARFFGKVALSKSQLDGAIVVKCSK
jgi:demethylmenaquinone methyltransferase / 2-methoxy-6-polyprenyl-1,4-benzoquinol methylase